MPQLVSNFYQTLAQEQTQTLTIRQVRGCSKQTYNVLQMMGWPRYSYRPATVRNRPGIVILFLNTILFVPTNGLAIEDFLLSSTTSNISCLTTLPAVCASLFALLTILLVFSPPHAPSRCFSSLTESLGHFRFFLSSFSSPFLLLLACFHHMLRLGSSLAAYACSCFCPCCLHSCCLVPITCAKADYSIANLFTVLISALVDFLLSNDTATVGTPRTNKDARPSEPFPFTARRFPMPRRRSVGLKIATAARLTIFCLFLPITAVVSGVHHIHPY